MKKIKFKAGFRLHWLSWLTLLLLSACMTVIVIPGAVVPASDDVLASHWQLPATSKLRSGSMLSHGWPCEYMQSDLHSFEPRSDVIAWTSRDAWAVGNKVFSLELKSLMIDLLIAGVIIAVGTLAVEFWRRRRKGVWFSLLDMFVGIALVAVVTSWYQGHASDYAAEAHALRAISPSVGEQAAGLDHHIRHSQTPDWLTRLVGGESQIPCCEHVTAVSIFAGDNDGVQSHQPIDVLRALAGFKRAEAIRVRGPLHPELPSAVDGLKRLRILVLDYDDYHMKIDGHVTTYDPTLPVASMNCVRDNACAGGWKKSIVYDDFLWKLIDQKVRSLETLQKLDQLEQLTAIELNLGYISADGWRAIPSLSKLSKISFASREVFIEDLEVLEQFTNLKQVWLSISATKQELENFQRTHPQLELKWDSASEITSSQVFQRRLTTWKLVDSYRKKELHLNFHFSWWLDLRSVDLTDFKLTMERLEVINANVDWASVTSISIGRIDSVQTLKQLIKYCSSLRTLDLAQFKLTMERLEVINANADLASVTDVSIGRIDSSQTVKQLVKYCSSLRTLDLSHLELEFLNEVIDQLVLPKWADLEIRQGDLTVEDLHVLIKKHQLSLLVVYDSTLSDADSAALEEAWPDVFISNYDDVPVEFQSETEPRSWPGHRGVIYPLD